MVLGYSRVRYVEFTQSQDLPTFLACHLRAFAYFDGVTAPSSMTTSDRLFSNGNIRQLHRNFIQRSLISGTTLDLSLGSAGSIVPRRKVKLNEQSGMSKTISCMVGNSTHSMTQTFRR